MGQKETKREKISEKVISDLKKEELPEEIKKKFEDFTEFLSKNKIPHLVVMGWFYKEKEENIIGLDSLLSFNGTVGEMIKILNRNYERSPELMDVIIQSVIRD